MNCWLLAFLIGVVCGLRPFTGLAAISIAASTDRLGVTGSKIAFLGYRYTLWVFAVLALAEYVTDQLPKTPSRKVPQQFTPRLLQELSAELQCVLPADQHSSGYLVAWSEPLPGLSAEPRDGRSWLLLLGKTCRPPSWKMQSQLDWLLVVTRNVV